AGARRAGDQAMAIAQPRLQEYLAALRGGDGLAEQDRIGWVGHAGFRVGDGAILGRFWRERARPLPPCDGAAYPAGCPSWCPCDAFSQAPTTAGRTAGVRPRARPCVVASRRGCGSPVAA